MADVVDTAFSFPVIVYTVASIVLLGFWILTTLVGYGLEDVDLDFDGSLDLDVDTGIDGDVELDSGSSSMLKTTFELLGITGMPLLLALNLLAILAWLISIIAMILLDGSSLLAGSGGWVVRVAVLIISLFAGGFLTGRLGNALDGLFVPHDAIRHRDLVGRRCTITTERVSADFGQAEVRDDEGASLIIQVRHDATNELRSGDVVLIVDRDTEQGADAEQPRAVGSAIFHVVPLENLDNDKF